MAHISGSVREQTIIMGQLICCFSKIVLKDKLFLTQNLVTSKITLFNKKTTIEYQANGDNTLFLPKNRAHVNRI